MATLSAVYSGSRSIRGGTWRAFEIFSALGAEGPIVFGGRMGVVDIVGRLCRAAGSMSGMLGSFEVRLLVLSKCGLPQMSLIRL
jgi:hypothetical protein